MNHNPYQPIDRQNASEEGYEKDEEVVAGKSDEMGKDDLYER